jgi:hypothetical protein
VTVATPHWENDPAGRRCGRCRFWGLPLARAAGYCAREGNPYGDEQTNPNQGCGLFAERMIETHTIMRDGGGAMSELSDVRNVPGAPGWFVGEDSAGCVLLFDVPHGRARVLAVDCGLDLHVLDDHRVVDRIPSSAYRALIDRAYGRAL